MNIILIGPPGAGKGTQAKRLRDNLGLPSIASGDIFRDMQREDTPLAHEVRAYMDRGEYVPDELTIEVVLKRLNQPDAREGFLLDGFPRTEPQAQALDHALEEWGRAVDLALYITAPVALLEERLQGRIICPQCHTIYNLKTNPPKHDMICDVCGHHLERRSDERVDVIPARLRVYMEQTKPVIDYYRARGILDEIDGARSMEEVNASVDAVIARRRNPAPAGESRS
jgi:adenylate kinase